jgi:hypothetical protein
MERYKHHTKTTHDVAKEINNWLVEKVLKYRARSSYVPYDKTFRAVCKSWRAMPPLELKRLKIYQLDDVRGVFAQGFKAELPGYIVHPPKEFVQADLGILGLGDNGHVAFHEPGIPWEFKFGSVNLHKETAEKLGLEPGTEATTYGVGALRKTKALLLMMSLERYYRVFLPCVLGDDSLPVSGILDHKDLTVLIVLNDGDLHDNNLPV